MSAEPRALVIDVGNENGLATLRSLGRRGVRVEALSSDPLAIGLVSRYGTPHHCPDVVDDPDGLIRFLIDLGAQAQDPWS